ncbi:MAG: Mpo1-like protein [Sphingobium sp.]
MRRFRTFREFWPYYLQEHARPLTRALHYAGTSLVIALLVTAVVESHLWPLAILPLAGYGFAWFAHLRIEQNRPATFRHPLWSLVADFRMFFRFMTGRISDDLRLAGIRADGTIDPALRL